MLRIPVNPVSTWAGDMKAIQDKYANQIKEAREGMTQCYIRMSGKGTHHAWCAVFGRAGEDPSACDCKA